ncbi:MAG: RagB/SusD family nutrient uptake outer membrane protein [Prevotella sp.]
MHIFKYQHILLAVALTTLFTACDDKLDITPKGKTTLEKTSEIEELLNNDWDLGSVYPLVLVDNECYSSENVTTLLSKTNSLDYVLLTYNDSIDRASLTAENEIYTKGYKNINYANTVIEKLADATDGTDAEKAEIDAEAHLLRAYMHYLMVNIYAAQYDETTAEEEGGVPYVNNTDVFETKGKNTVAEVYDQILADCDQTYIDLLPDEETQEIRGSKAWGYSVRAKVLFQMKRYSEALPLALKALEYNGNIEDRTSIKETNEWVMEEIADHHIFYINNGMGYPWGETLSLETLDQFEDGDLVMDYAQDWGYPFWDDYYGELLSGVKGSRYCSSFGLYWNNWGITAEQMYYLAAECYIRTGEIQKGLDLVNKVRKYRIDPDKYADFTASTEKEAMALLQKAKRIECIATYNNFFDDKRWNSEDDYKKTITRTMPLTNGETRSFSIAPDSKLWIFPFPANATRYNSTLTQNYE